MGQYWQVINLDKRETFGVSGKLGEWLFDASKYLLFSLMVATKPPKLPECDSLIRPYKQGVVLEKWLIKTTFRSPPKADQRSLLAKLPLDIIDEIFSHLGPMEDLIFLSMTCQALWEIGRHAMYRRIASKIAALSWAGDRIICVGDYLRNEDIPENLLTAEEQEEVEEYDSLYEFPFNEVSREERKRRAISDLFIVGRVGRFLPERGAYFDYPLLLSLVDTSFELEWPRSAAFVLRNLSRRQYVRGTTLTEWREKTTAIIPQVKDITFNEIILCRICLSSNSSVSMSYKGNIHRGVWAGDRFDFVGKDWADGLKDEDEAWTDVSAEVLGEVEAIWASEYGRRR